jgi:hypothetical protein
MKTQNKREDIKKVYGLVVIIFFDVFIYFEATCQLGNMSKRRQRRQPVIEPTRGHKQKLSARLHEIYGAPPKPRQK